MTRIVASLLGAGCLTAALSAPAQAELSICNDTNINASIAIGYLGGDQWTSEGWWNAAPGACVTVVDQPQPQAYYYWHAVNENGEFVSEDYYFCAVDDVFTIVGDNDCAARGHNRISFNEIQIDASGAMQVRLTAALAPTAPVARKSAEPTAEPAAQPQKSQEAETAAVALPEPEPAPEPVPEPAPEPAVAEPAPADGPVPQPTLALTTDIPVAELLTTTPLDLPAIKANLIGDWNQDQSPGQTSVITRDRFEDFEDGTAKGQGGWRLAAACPGHPGDGIGVLVTYDDRPDERLCLVLQSLSETGFSLVDPAGGESLSYSR